MQFQSVDENSLGSIVPRPVWTTRRSKFEYVFRFDPIESREAGNRMIASRSVFASKEYWNA